jgi:hypothetical protein
VQRFIINSEYLHDNKSKNPDSLSTAGVPARFALIAPGHSNTAMRRVPHASPAAADRRRS